MQAGRPTAMLVLQDGTVVPGQGYGAVGGAAGEIVFNTAMTGYQEILTDPSYAGQIVTFTFPHVGNVGTNDEDVEAPKPYAGGLVTRAAPTPPANWRSRKALEAWLVEHGVVGIAGVDTRRLTARLRDRGAQNAVVHHDPAGRFDLDALKAAARALPSMTGQDLATGVSSPQPYDWTIGFWRMERGDAPGSNDGPHVVVLDYGVKRNILRALVDLGCRVTVVPISTPAEAVLALDPDGVVLANGPGDPAATGVATVPEVRKLVECSLPVMGICLGHQLLGLAVGAPTEKMAFGHHGANHPVQDLTTGKVEITSQNHGFAIKDGDLPAGVEVTHRSLFDGTIQGIRLRDKPVFSIQYHPEASPGPHDSRYLFRRFVDALRGGA
ncbi:MAG: glutamine-hydrolyzing carbamoyl-phosphate synthase small subunit [Geminicoccaceae bacterium]|nr:glutamine-hydrolyzing carbamoyl-phosphate synthase small subunit [Geminicoccaceae bacterium]